MVKKKRRMKHNPPPGAVEIYDKVIAIEAQKNGRGKSLFPKEFFRHDFKKNKTSASIYGLPDGSLLIKSKRGKRLWKKFKYEHGVDY